ncbi:Paf1/RNA polymerase II complex component LEO1 [Babesia caballi]|uniref:Paf1/RNA polymerase II complex component LEO1 n=1 Tax=Babesia caballi TaxID=5871 RepID=A0AAV4LM07_BABCB|nr:Paf1/RNA polymerase II complex component LEO1 [Babesia caballi]
MAANDDAEHGLFEDSEDSVAEPDAAPYLTTVEDTPAGALPAPSQGHASEADPEPEPEPIESKLLNKSIKRSTYPGRDHHLVICKFPPTFCMATTPFTEAEERQVMHDNRKLLEDPVCDDISAMMRWRLSAPSPGSDAPFGAIETNTHFVEWDDGTLTLFVGKTPLNVDCRSETVFLLEDSRPDLKHVHAVITERLQTKFSNILKNKFLRSKEVDAKRQRMTLTSIADAVSSTLSLQRHRLVSRENDRFRRLQQSTAYHARGLTRKFLESDSESP